MRTLRFLKNEISLGKRVDGTIKFLWDCSLPQCPWHYFNGLYSLVQKNCRTGLICANQVFSPHHSICFIKNKTYL